MWRIDKEECSFLKKRTKKLLPIAHAAGDSGTALTQVFCFFFSKKKIFLPVCFRSVEMRAVALAVAAALMVQPAMAGAVQPGIVPPAKVGLDAGRLDRFDALVDTNLAAKTLAGAVVVVARHGHVAFVKTYGDADVASGRKMAPDTIFRIYSMSKPIVAVGAMMLYEQGKFDLRDPISKWIPEFAHMQVAVPKTDASGHKTIEMVPASRPITVLDLMRHTSGLGYFFTPGPDGKPYYLRYGISSTDTDLDLAAWTKKLAGVPLINQPGAEFYYSYSIDVLGRLVEIWSGKPLDVYLHDAIFSKLGMKDTGFYVPADKQGRLATLYTPSTPGVMDAEGINGLGGPIVRVPSGKTHQNLFSSQQDAFMAKPALLSGGGGLVSTALDYIRFVMMLSNGGVLDGVRLLSPKTVELIGSDVLGDIPRGPGGPWNGDGFGLTVEVSKGIGETATLSSAGEFDWAGVAGTQFFVDPKEQLVAVMMMQVIPGAPYWGRMLRQVATQAVVGP